MIQEHLIPVQRFCESHQLSISFIKTLEEYGLVELTVVNETSFVNDDELPMLEKFIRLYHDLNINPEGIEIIHRLLLQLEELHYEIKKLKNKLSIYEPDQTI